jgi:ABC-type nitrate/sulfonate/bicarbonate transport system permease component
MLPIIQQARAVPPAALVPFLLLWFGFSEIGKYLLVVSGIGFNLAIAGIQIVQDVPERYRAAFVTFPLGRFKRFMYFDVYRILENLLPAIRVSVAIALGLVIVAEYLGSQAGLGYLIQASRSTFALQTVVLCVILLGILAAIADMIIVWLWVRIIYWRR